MSSKILSQRMLFTFFTIASFVCHGNVHSVCDANSIYAVYNGGSNKGSARLTGLVAGNPYHDSYAHFVPLEVVTVPYLNFTGNLAAISAELKKHTPARTDDGKGHDGRDTFFSHTNAEDRVFAAANWVAVYAQIDQLIQSCNGGSLRYFPRAPVGVSSAAFQSLQRVYSFFYSPARTASGTPSPAGDAAARLRALLPGFSGLATTFSTCTATLCSAVQADAATKMKTKIARHQALIETVTGLLTALQATDGAAPLPISAELRRNVIKLAGKVEKYRSLGLKIVRLQAVAGTSSTTMSRAEAQELLEEITGFGAALRDTDEVVLRQALVSTQVTALADFDRLAEDLRAALDRMAAERGAASSSLEGLSPDRRLLTPQQFAAAQQFFVPVQPLAPWAPSPESRKIPPTVDGGVTFFNTYLFDKPRFDQVGERIRACQEAVERLFVEWDRRGTAPATFPVKSARKGSAHVSITFVPGFPVVDEAKKALGAMGEGGPTKRKEDRDAAIQNGTALLEWAQTELIKNIRYFTALWMTTARPASASSLSPMNCVCWNSPTAQIFAQMFIPATGAPNPAFSADERQLYGWQKCSWGYSTTNHWAPTAADNRPGGTRDTLVFTPPPAPAPAPAVLPAPVVRPGGRR